VMLPLILRVQDNKVKESATLITIRWELRNLSQKLFQNGLTCVI
jgi:hypothetical protein